MDYYANVLAERHLIAGALLFWPEFAPYAGRVREEFFSGAELLYLWRAAARGQGVVGCPPSLADLALELMGEYDGASPSALLALLGDVAPRRRLQDVAAGMIQRISNGDPLADIIDETRRKLAEVADGIS